MRKFSLVFIMILSFSGFVKAQTMEDFECFKMNLMAGPATDLSTFTVVPNPAATGINPSAYVVEFKRDKDGVPWGGFWTTLPTVIDVTTNKYIHVKVWKSRISPVKLKIEGGAAGTIELLSKYPQTKINQWEDMVFDCTDKTGTYPIIAFMPDFEDPLTLTSDITMYFDDFILNNNPNPIGTPEQTFNVDMSTAPGFAAGTPVYITGSFGGNYGTWTGPGENALNELTDSNSDLVYSITMNLPDGVYEFKFAAGTGWNGADNGPGNRVISIAGNLTVDYQFGTSGIISETRDENVIIENFESLKTNLMEGGANGAFSLVPNPDPSGVNKSDYVTKFVRPFDGKPWSGFYGTLGTPVDFSTNKYVHIKVWKPRISPVKFKIEAGITGDIELTSTDPQTVVNGWEDLVFDFSAADGEYAKIVFMPDFEDPLTLTEDIVLYFDDFILNNDPIPAVGVRDNKLSEKAQMYPNPVANELFINTNDAVSKVTISSMRGQVIGSYDLISKSNTTINTSSLSSGMYFVTFTGKDGSLVTKKMIKQ
jgi:hypothetical protein